MSETTIERKADDYITCNIVNEDLYKDIVNRTLKKIADSLKKSLGYYGSSTIIEDKVNGHIATKDGYTILSNMKFENPIAVTIYEIIKKISFNLVQTVGDGSTSSIVIAQELFECINDSIKNGNLRNVSPKEIFDTLKEIEKDLIKQIENVESIKITDNNFEELKKIASVSNNNDEKTGENIYNIYKKIKDKGFIYVENSHDNEDHYEFLEGIEFASGMIADDFSNNKNKPEFKVKNPFIFMCNDRLDSTDLNLFVDLIGSLLSRQTKPVVIIAKSFSAEFVSCWQINKRTQNNLQICLVDFNLANSNQEGIFQDIAIYTNSEIFDKQNFNEEDIKKNFYKSLGSCDEIIITNKTTRIIGKKCSDEELKNRIEYLNEMISTYKENNQDGSLNSRIFQLETRRSSLESNIVKYYVGGDTEFEKENRKYLIEDSIFACRAALKTGYVIGGNLIIPQIIYHISSTNFIYNELLRLIYSSFKECYKCVLSNKIKDENQVELIATECIKDRSFYNLKTDQFEYKNNYNIINSALTEIEILKAVISIIGLLVTSNQYIGKSY